MAVNRKPVRSHNSGCMTGPSRILSRLKRVENGFLSAEIPAIEPTVAKHHPVPPAAGLAHFEYRTGHRNSSSLRGKSTQPGGLPRVAPGKGLSSGELIQGGRIGSPKPRPGAACHN